MSGNLALFRGGDWRICNTIDENLMPSGEKLVKMYHQLEEEIGKNLI